MNFDDIKKLKTETDRVSKIYELFNEASRLTLTKARQVEFITAITYINQYLNKTSKILDIGAGAGIYSLHYAKKGYHVDAIELSEANIKVFKEQITQDIDIDLKMGNALDLSAYPSDFYDVVLLMGPLYHLEKKEDQLKALLEAKRVLKKGGVLFTAFISNDMVFLTELDYNQTFFESDQYDHDTFDVVDFPFVFHTVDEAKTLIQDGGLITLKMIAQDGVSELMADKINQMSDESYKQYLRYHLYCAEKPEMLGRSNHMMFISRK